VITIVEVCKRLIARMELQRDRLPMKSETAAHVIKLLAPDIRELIRGEIADAKREWERRSLQQ
jgi:hypothetical protein